MSRNYDDFNSENFSNYKDDWYEWDEEEYWDEEEWDEWDEEEYWDEWDEEDYEKKYRCCDEDTWVEEKENWEDDYGEKYRYYPT